jgi:hypothetical protein
MPAFKDIDIENYTEKSFVVRGETKHYEDSMNALSGKWNDRLTDRATGDKFGAWIFPMTKKQMVQEWVRTGKHLTAPPASTNNNSSSAGTGGDTRQNTQTTLKLERAEAKIARLEELMKIVMAEIGIELVPDENTEEDEAPRKRFLA